MIKRSSLPLMCSYWGHLWSHVWCVLIEDIVAMCVVFLLRTSLEPYVICSYWGQRSHVRCVLIEDIPGAMSDVFLLRTSEPCVMCSYWGHPRGHEWCVLSKDIPGAVRDIVYLNAIFLTWRLAGVDALSRSRQAHRIIYKFVTSEIANNWQYPGQSPSAPSPILIPSPPASLYYIIALQWHSMNNTAPLLPGPPFVHHCNLVTLYV